MLNLGSTYFYSKVVFGDVIKKKVVYDDQIYLWHMQLGHHCKIFKTDIF